MNIKKCDIIKKISAALIAVTMCCAVFISDYSYRIYADNIDAYEARRDELIREKTAIDELLDEYGDKASELQGYLDEYDNKMRIQEELVDNAKKLVELCQIEIDELSINIANSEIEVQEGIEIFGKRLRAMYISGNDGLVSVLAGTSDFYDMLVRIELYERISRKDSEIISGLKEKIENLNADKLLLEKKVLELEQNQLNESEYYDELRDIYNNHSETLAMNKAMIDDYERRADEIMAENKRLDEQIQEEIRERQAAAEKRRAEEEQRRKDEEERKKQEAEDKGEQYVPQDTAMFTSYSDTGFIWPVPTVRNMGDGYGERWFEEENRYQNHGGIDIVKPNCAGECIVASAAGEVITAGWSDSFGNYVVIDHGNQVSTLYAHCSSLAVSAGDIVSQGQAVGYIGNTGDSYGAHLHFEVRINGMRTDPLGYVNVNN